MNNILLVGNSLVNAKAIELIRQQNKDVAITLVSSDGFYPYSRQALLNFLGKGCKEKQIFFKPDSFYKEEKVRVITGQAIARLNLKRNILVLENKEQIAYDVLVLGDMASPRFCEIKGNQKNGVFPAVQLTNVRNMLDQIPFVQTIIVQLNNLTGFLSLCALSEYSREIIVSCRQSQLLDRWLDAESSSMLRQMMEIAGIRLMLDNPIEEILGDSDVKAVRLKSGKVLSAEMVVIDDLRCDTRLLKDVGLEYSSEREGLANVNSNYSNVFWVDAVGKAYLQSDENHYEILDYENFQQAKQLVCAIVKDAELQLKAESDFVMQFALKDLKGCWFGSTMSRSEVEEYSRYYPERNVYKKFFCCQGQLVGGFLLGDEKLFNKYITLYRNKTVIQMIDEELFAESQEDGVLVDMQQQG